MAKILSGNEVSENTIKNFFIPSFAGTILLFLLGTGLLLVYNINQIITWVDNNYLGANDNLKLSLNALSHNLSNSFDSALGGRLGLIIIWSLVGALTYILIWFIKNIFNGFENDVIIDHYLHPYNYNRAGYWGSAMAGKVFFGIWLILLLTYTFFAAMVVMPAVAIFIDTALNNFKLPQSVFYALLCVLIPTLLIYIWTLIVRIAAHLWALI